ncbi:hypothetical protein PoB_006433200 [Plakobranchus ocellatus]|uniref:Uncharacterized protein n=1 Tax=Plakobranchus ocellatus TaxID=259542 RepID=A0AAV4D100_9GAST|nr:hypothetical protein PoB_006433200 [Plakobranchus ocellatus]
MIMMMMLTMNINFDEDHDDDDNNNMSENKDIQKKKNTIKVLRIKSENDDSPSDDGNDVYGDDNGDIKFIISFSLMVIQQNRNVP